MNRWGVIENQDMHTDLCCFLHCDSSLFEGCIPVGMTCGVLLAVGFDPRHTLTPRRCI